MLENEDENIEYKVTLTKHLKREIVSFLNSRRGGTIYIGVDDKTHESQHVSDQERKTWEETITNWAISAFYPVPYSLIQVFPNATVFTVKVRAGRNKPYALASNGFDASGVYVRQGSSAVKASNEMVRRMQQRYQVSGEFDSEISNEQSLTFKVAHYVFEDLNLNFNKNALKLINDNHYNNAALLVSDQNPFSVKAASYEGTDVMSFKDKREFSGAITKQIDDVLNYLDLANRRQVMITGKGQRSERRDYPTVAIREAVVNALVHRDYLLHSSVKVEMFDDRLEVVSPGGIPDGLTLDEIKDGLTAARNPRLIHILDKMQYIENYGTGIRRIYKAYDDSDAKPVFEVRENSFKVIFPNRNYVLDIKKKNNAVTLDLNDGEKLILKVLQSENRAMKRKEIEKASGLSRSKVFSGLKSLIAARKVEALGVSVSNAYRDV